MVRKIIGALAGLVTWLAVALIAGLVLRAAWPAYAKVADDMTFTLSMKLVRLGIGAVATVAAGWLTTAIARTPMVAALVGVVLLLAFIPQHISLWQKFPLWYHLTFLASLIPLSVWGGRISASNL